MSIILKVYQNCINLDTIQSIKIVYPKIHNDTILLIEIPLIILRSVCY